MAVVTDGHFIFRGNTMFFQILILALIAGCSSTRPTPYQKEKKKQGYRDNVIEEIKVASFKGNSYTKKDRARSFAEFRAIENCRNESKHANIIDVFDKTIEKEITRSSGGAWGPSFYGGMYPYYSRYSSIGVGIDYSTISTNSWNETLIFPYIEVYYTCANAIFRPQVHFKELSSEQIKHLVKDVKGAIQVENVLKGSPNKNSVQLGDIVLKANGKRIEKVYELIRMFNAENRDISLQMLREGNIVVSKLQSTDVTKEVIGTEEEIIQNVCRYKKDDKQLELKKREICQ